MKKLMLMLAIVGITYVANAQTSKKDSNKEKEKTEQMALKDHKCSDACMKTGNCVYAHGEKGHNCGEECKTMMNKDEAMKDHKCTDACMKAGKCVYAHGEKGHNCGEECKKVMK